MNAKTHLQELKNGQCRWCGGPHVMGGGENVGETMSCTPVCKESMETVEKHKGKLKKNFKLESQRLSFMF